MISALGATVSENLDALVHSRSGISKITHLSTLHKNKIKVGEVAATNDRLTEQLQLPKHHNFTRTALLGAIAAKEAVAQSGIGSVRDSRTGLISATTIGGMDYTERYYKEFESNPEFQRYITSHPLGDSTHKIADILGVTGFTTTISTACSSAANAILLGARMIRSGILDRVIVGGTDALSKFTINGFNSLLILSDERCRPFDANRNGLNLGEGAAYLVLASENVVTAQKSKVLGYVSGYGNANDAFHQTASSEKGDGAYLAMEKALKSANLMPENIDYINAHGTATINNDRSESVALQRIFGAKMPSFSSTKAFTGHTLAAAGGVEAVFSILALQEQLVFPNLGFKTPIIETRLTPETKLQKQKITHVLSNSLGFGGNCTSLIFSEA